MCYYSGFPKERLELKFRLRTSFHSALNRSKILNTHVRVYDGMVSTWHGVMAEVEKLLRRKISTDTVYNKLKMHTKYVHSVRG